MNKKLLTLMFGMVFLILTVSMASASISNLGDYEKGQDVRLLQATSDYDDCNITSVVYPNSTKAMGEVEMIEDGATEYYYTYNKTSQIGEYKVNGVCSNSVTSETFSYFFDVVKVKDQNLVNILFFATMALGILIYAFSYSRDESGHTILISGAFFIVSGLISINYMGAFFDSNINNMAGYLLLGIGLIVLGDAMWRLFPNK